MAGQVERNEPPARGEVGVVQHVHELPRVGAGSVQADQWDSPSRFWARLLEIEAVRDALNPRKVLA